MSFNALKALLGEPAPRSEKPGTRSSDKVLVLVIDDDESIRRSLEFLLRDLYQVVSCATARDGVRVFNNEISAVILDVKMDTHDGFWACDQVRRVQPDIPVIFYSAYQDAKDPYRIINEHRPFGYISKDGDPKKLLETLAMAVQLYQSTLRMRRVLEKMKRDRSAP
jgi:DNA-binding NtrC family response regulator